jgi:formylglycine-generating enzyme required for sulfatase activity
MSILSRRSLQTVFIMICFLSFFCCNNNPAKPTNQGSQGAIPSETLSVWLGLVRHIVMKDIPAGTFTMGSDSSIDSGAQPPHQVTLSAFKMQEAEVTQEQYLAVMDTNPSYFDSGTNASLRPVEQVSWYDAVRYCNALSKLSDLDTVYNTTTWTADFAKSGYRLPTEAQWEYACRAGSTTEYWWGPDTNGMGARTWVVWGWVWLRVVDTTTHPVATKQANAYGLYDMTGNVIEWCNDWYAAYTGEAATDPTGPATGTLRVVRGGSVYPYIQAYLCCYTSYAFFRSAYRGQGGDYCGGLGFRVVLPR